MPVSTAGCFVYIAAMPLVRRLVCACVCVFSQKPLSMLLPDKDSQHQDGTEAELCLRHLREARGGSNGGRGSLIFAGREGPER